MIRSLLINDKIRLLIKLKKMMFQTQRRDNRLDLSISNKLSVDLRKAVKSSKLAHYRRIADELNNRKPALNCIGRF